MSALTSGQSFFALSSEYKKILLDEIHFLGGLSKDKILEAAAVDFFCDDSEAHLVPASKKVPTGKVPYATGSEMKNLKK